MCLQIKYRYQHMMCHLSAIIRVKHVPRLEMVLQTYIQNLVVDKRFCIIEVIDLFDINLFHCLLMIELFCLSPRDPSEVSCLEIKAKKPGFRNHCVV